jgi:7,8-dihydroneopterin aldolase/epimerase/oxygenase
MDKLAINGIKITTLIGIHPWEKKCPQNIYLDIALATNAKQVALQDSLEAALDYDKILQHILHFTSENHFHLIETLAEKLAQEIINHFPTEWIQLTIHKPGAVAIAKDISITIERTNDVTYSHS